MSTDQTPEHTPDQTPPEPGTPPDTPAAAPTEPMIPAVPPAAGPPPSAPMPALHGPAAARDSAWRSFWANPFGKAAVVAGSCLAVLTLAGGIALAATGGFSDHDEWRGGPAARHLADRDRVGPEGMGPERRGPGRDGPGGQGQDPMGPRGQGQSGRGQGSPGSGAWHDSMVGRLPLGDALHGELTLGGDTARTILYQVGEVTEVTAGSSVTVASSDGFTATYGIDDETLGRVDTLASGQQVRVIADAEGAAARVIMPVGRSGTQSS